MTNAQHTLAQPIPTSSVATGFNHVAILSRDLDRLTAFYADVLDATIVDIPAPPGTHAALVQLSANAGMAVMQMLDGDASAAAPGSEMLDRGHIDHIAFDAPNAVALETLRRRLVERGASDGLVHDYGPFLSVGFTDPDGMRTEAVWVRDPSMTGAHPPVDFSGSLLDLDSSPDGESNP